MIWLASAPCARVFERLIDEDLHPPRRRDWPRDHGAGLARARCLKSDGLTIETEEALIGGAAVDATGKPLPDATLRIAKESDAVLLAAVGGPQYDVLPRDQRPERGLLAIRKELNTFANLRPRCSTTSWRAHRR